MYNKIEFIEYMATEYNMTKKAAAEAYTQVFGTLETLLAEKKQDVRTPIGVFKVKDTPEREFTIMLGERKGEKGIAPAKKRISYSAGKAIRDSLKNS